MSASNSVNGRPPTFTPTANRDPARDLSHSFDHIIHSNISRPASQRNSPYPSDSYFEDAFRSTPSPPPTSFLDYILNPADDGALPFGYQRHVSPPRPRHCSPVVSISAGDTASAMPPARQRPGRLPNGYVDLTTTPSPPQEPGPAPRRTKRESPTPGPSTKRLKRNDGSSARQERGTLKANTEEIDLSDDKAAVQEVLQRQRAEAVMAQQKPEEKATTFKTFTCVICMDTPTDITATLCGHLFCHTCLMEALIAGENRSGPNEPKRSQCPVCRRFVSRTKANDVIPLLLKKGLSTQPRKSSVPTKVT